MPLFLAIFVLPKMEKEFKKAYGVLLVVSIVCGTTYLASRVCTEHIPGFFVSAIRQFVSGLILVTLVILKGHSLPAKNESIQIAIQGIILLCIGNAFSSWSVQYISTGLASKIASCVPLFVALFSQREPRAAILLYHKLGFLEVRWTRDI